MTDEATNDNTGEQEAFRRRVERIRDQDEPSAVELLLRRVDQLYSRLDVRRDEVAELRYIVEAIAHIRTVAEADEVIHAARRWLEAHPRQ